MPWQTLTEVGKNKFHSYQGGGIRWMESAQELSTHSSCALMTP